MQQIRKENILNTLKFILLFIPLFFSFVTSGYAIDVTLAWDANTESDLDGYWLYYKTSALISTYNGIGATEGDSPIYISLQEISNPEQPEYTIHGLDENETYYFVLTAYDINGNESGYSNEVYNDKYGDGYGDACDPPSVEVRVTSGSDDAEENSSGGMYLTSSDLELVYDSYHGADDQTVGIRFTELDIPQGATIVNAYVQFQVDKTSSVATSLTIEGEAIDDAPTLTSSNWNISDRTRTVASVAWSPVVWTTVGHAGPDQRTPDISSIIQEIVDQPGWLSGNSLVVIITGIGERVAESYNGNPNGAPLLHVEYSAGG